MATLAADPGGAAVTDALGAEGGTAGDAAAWTVITDAVGASRDISDDELSASPARACDCKGSGTRKFRAKHVTTSRFSLTATQYLFDAFI